MPETITNYLVLKISMRETISMHLEKYLKDFILNFN